MSGSRGPRSFVAKRADVVHLLAHEARRNACGYRPTDFRESRPKQFARSEKPISFHSDSNR